MQETRQHILEILRESGQATVEDILEKLRQRRGEITAVTVRHHLTRLQEDQLVTAPEFLHRSKPGRPQHVYKLTEKALEFFPDNYPRLIANLLDQLRLHLPPDGVNVILEGVADRMAHESSIQDLPLERRVIMAADYLNQHGYDAFLECVEDGYILHTRNCPYHKVAQGTGALCDMDMRLVASLLNVAPRLLSRMSAGDQTCSYLIPGRPAP